VQQDGKPPMRQAQSSGAKATPVVPPVVRKPGDLEDYRALNDPKNRKVGIKNIEELPLFGSSYFDPSRKVLEAQFAAYGAMTKHKSPTTDDPALQGNGNAHNLNSETGQVGPRMPTTSEMEVLSQLTDAQRILLLEAQHSGKLSEAERIKYRLLLFPSTVDPLRSATREELSAVTSLTDSDRVDLLGKLRSNKLTEQETSLYRTYLFPVSDEQVRSGKVGPATTQADARKGAANGLKDDRSVLNGTTSPSTPGQQQPNVDAFRQVANPLATVLQSVTASAPQDYQLGQGDQITLRYWSPTLPLREDTLTVDSTGAITVPTVGRVIVRGQTASQAEAALTQRLSQRYRNVSASLSLSELRTIPITIAGEAYFPGTWQVPAVATAFNVLNAAGGPSEQGSYRRIELTRRGKVVGTLDLYKLFSNGKFEDLPLQAGDVLFVPTREITVSVRGEVRKPARFEALPKETIADAIALAGGAKPSGVVQNVHVSTVQPGAARVIRDINLADLSTKGATPLYDSDDIEITSVQARFSNTVTLEGAVDQPGDYEITPDMTIADLVGRARGLLPEAHQLRADLYRYNPNETALLIPVDLGKAIARDPQANLKLARWDRLRIYTRDEAGWVGDRQITIQGAVKTPGIYYRFDAVRILDLLLQAGGPTPEAALEQVKVLHQHPDGTFSYDFVNLREAMKGDKSQDILLQERDIVEIYRANEVQFTPKHTFTIAGEVVSPGVYERGTNMRLSDVLRIAKGVTPRAGDRIQIAHARQNQDQQPVISILQPTRTEVQPDVPIQDGDVIVIQGRGEYQESPSVVQVTGAVRRPGPVILRGRTMRLSDALADVGGITPDGYAEGAVFTRKPELLETAGQKQLSESLNRMNDRFNQIDFRIQSGKSDVEKAKALGGATNASVGLPGLTGSTASSGNAAQAAASSLITKELVSPARQLTNSDLTPSGNVAINLQSALQKPGGSDDFLLVDGDTLTIPEKPTTVQVIGAVMDSRGILYSDKKPLDYYVNHAGGFAQDAATDRILVLRLGGGLLPAKKAGQIRAGDLILVPTKVLAAKLSERRNALEDIFKNTVNSVLIFFFAKRLVGL
jgi:protein involved in polysaccharide export with SLBB domain